MLMTNRRGHAFTYSAAHSMLQKRLLYVSVHPTAAAFLLTWD